MDPERESPNPGPWTSPAPGEVRDPRLGTMTADRVGPTRPERGERERPFPESSGLPARLAARRPGRRLTVWAVLVPESLAYATIAGVSPVVGLYAAAAALVLYAPLAAPATWSSARCPPPRPSRPAPSPTVAAGSHDFVALTTALAVATGVSALVAGLLRLGFLASFISEPVIKGFIVGLALTIIIGPAAQAVRRRGRLGQLLREALGTFTALGETHWPTFVVGLLSLVLVLGLRRFLPLVPGSLVAVAAGHRSSSAVRPRPAGRRGRGHHHPGLPHVGLPSGLRWTYLSLVGPAVGVMLVGFAEGLGAAKTYAARAGYDVDANKELLGLGAANVAPGSRPAWSSTAACPRPR